VRFVSTSEDRRQRAHRRRSLETKSESVSLPGERRWARLCRPRPRRLFPSLLSPAAAAARGRSHQAQRRCLPQLAPSRGLLPGAPWRRKRWQLGPPPRVWSRCRAERAAVEAAAAGAGPLFPLLRAVRAFAPSLPQQQQLPLSPHQSLSSRSPLSRPPPATPPPPPTTPTNRLKRARKLPLPLPLPLLLHPPPPLPLSPPVLCATPRPGSSPCRPPRRRPRSSAARPSPRRRGGLFRRGLLRPRRLLRCLPRLPLRRPWPRTQARKGGSSSSSSIGSSGSSGHRGPRSRPARGRGRPLSWAATTCFPRCCATTSSGTWWRSTSPRRRQCAT